MNTSQEDKLSMYYVTKSTCEENQAIWASDAVFAASYNLWAAKVPLIEQNRDAQTLETTGITTEKKTKRNSMTDQALFIANRLQSYANVTSNSELLESVHYTASDMKKARDNDVIGICNTILAIAKTNAASIVSYGVTAAMITDLEAAIAAYVEILAKPKTAKSQTKTATENLLRLFKEADEILDKRLDLDIEPYRTSAPKFYSQYNTARMVIPTSGRISAVLGSVTDASSGEPIKGVMFTFTAATNPAALTVKKSAEKGNFRIDNLPEDTYQLTVKKIGYKEQTLSVTVASGETTYLNVKLEKA